MGTGKAELKRVTAKIVCWLMLFCVLSGGQPALAFRPAPKPDTVYCPLSKGWVKRLTPQLPKAKPALKDICSAPERKEQFFMDVSKRYGLIRFAPNSEAAEKLFFSYLRKGRQALSALSGLPKDPTRESVLMAGRGQKAAPTFAFDFANKRVESGTIGWRPRPPTTPPLTDHFPSTKVTGLEGVSRHLRPRAPPFSV